MVINMSEKEIIEKIKNQNKKLEKKEQIKRFNEKSKVIFNTAIKESNNSFMLRDQEQRGLKLKKSY